MLIYSPEQGRKVCQDLNGRLADIIKTADEFRDVMHDISPNQRTVVYQAFKGHLPKVARTAEDFRTLLLWLSPVDRTDLYQAFKAYLAYVIKTADNLSDVLKFLSPNQCTEVCQTFEGHLKDVIKTADDFRVVLERLSPEQRTEVCQVLKGKLTDVIRTRDNLNCLLDFLSQEQQTNILQKIEDNFNQLQSLIENGDWEGNGIREMREVFKEVKETKALTRESVGEKLDLYNKIKIIAERQPLHQNYGCFFGEIQNAANSVYKLINNTLALGDENLPDLINAIKKEPIETTLPLKFMYAGFTNT